MKDIRLLVSAKKRFRNYSAKSDTKSIGNELVRKSDNVNVSASKRTRDSNLAPSAF